MVQLFRDGRSYAHAFMNWQTKEQLNVEFMLNARAQIIDSRTVEAGGRRFTGQNMVIGTGAHVKVPQIPGLEMHGVYDFATLIEDLDYEPGKCVVIGGGKTAVEYGSFFNATGCETTIVTRSGIMQTPSLHHVDDDVRDYVTEGMRKRGITILEGAEPVEVRGSGTVSDVVVRLRSGETVTLGTESRDTRTGYRDELAGLKGRHRVWVVFSHRHKDEESLVRAYAEGMGRSVEVVKEPGAAAYLFDFSATTEPPR